MKNAHVMTAVLIPLIAWRIYRRIRTNIGRQKFSTRRSVAILMIFSLVAVLLAASTRFDFNLLIAEAAGLLLGAAIGLVGLKLTAFENTPEDCYYTPNSFLGISISVLLIGRVLYRFLMFSSFDPATQPQTPGLGQSPLTLGLFGLTAGYYLAYHAGLFAKRNGVQALPNKSE